MRIILQERIDVKKIIVPLLMFLLVAFQNSIGCQLKILGAIPDFVGVFIIGLALNIGNPWGTFIGLFGGILLDVFSGGAFGIQSIAYMITAYLIGLVEGKLYKDNVFIPGLFTFAGTFVIKMIEYVLLYLTRADVSISYYVTAVILPQALYNTLLTIIFFRYIVKLAAKLSISKPGGFNA